MSKQDSANRFVLTFKCPDQLGVVSRVSSLMSDCGAFITEISQYSDPETVQFFSRTVFEHRGPADSQVAFEQALAVLANELDIEYVLRPINNYRRILLAVSRYDHCMNVLLTKWRSGALGIDIAGIVSNHETARPMAEFYGLPFYHLPVSTDNKLTQEQALSDLMAHHEVDLLVLARYMQILSDNFCSLHPGRVINIHHSFLPGFKGAKPYHQAHERGVKVIGATAHFVTSDLDEGPIIVQEVKPIDHRVTVEQMVQIGHDLEATALSVAVKLYGEERILLNGVRTIVL